MYVASGHSITHDFLLLTPFPKITSPSVPGMFMCIPGPPESHSWASSEKTATQKEAALFTTARTWEQPNYLPTDERIEAMRGAHTGDCS